MKDNSKPNPNSFKKPRIQSRRLGCERNDKRIVIISAFRHLGVPAFTLIELMIVVAIIAVLVSILVPSLQEARDMAQTAACQMNLRHIGMAMANYLLDFRNYYPPNVYREDGAHGWPYGPSTTDVPWYSWAVLLYPYTQGNRNFFEPTDDAKAGNIFRCPTWLGTRSGPYANEVGMCSSYTYRTTGTFAGHHTHRATDNREERCFAPLYYSYIWNAIATWCDQTGWGHSSSDHYGFMSYDFNGSRRVLRSSEVKDQGAFVIADFRIGNIWVASSQRMWACGSDSGPAWHPVVGESADHGRRDPGPYGTFTTEVGWHHMDGFNALSADGSAKWTKWGESKDSDWSIQID
jgi:prepilin-type N-terminal cleavage/methylation domain-containing protein